MKRFSTTPCLLALIFAFSAQAKTFSAHGDSSVTVSDGLHESFKVDKTETLFFEDFYSSTDQPLLYKVVTKTSYDTAMEGMNVSSTITAINLSPSNFGQPLWVSEVNGGNFSIFSDELVATVVGGCCGSPDENQLINRQSGKVVAVTHDDSTSIFRVPNTRLPLRYLGKTYEENAPQEKNGKMYVATIIYFSKDGVISRARVYADLPSGWGTDIYDLKITGESVSVQGKWVDLWGSDGINDAAKAFSKFAVEGSLSYANQTESFKLIIHADTINPLLSTKSLGLTLDFP